MINLSSGMKVETRQDIVSSNGKKIAKGSIGVVCETTPTDREMVAPLNIFGQWFLLFESGWINHFESAFDDLYQIIKDA